MIVFFSGMIFDIGCFDVDEVLCVVEFVIVDGLFVLCVCLFFFLEYVVFFC